jgi:4'-phosphopantetheinyl transferase
VYAHASLRLLLARAVGDTLAESIALTTGPKGKPRLARERGDIHFSISYRNGYAALALGSAPLGIDIELIQDGIDMQAIADRYFTPHERNYLAAAAQSDRGSVFVRLWTRKEALVKAAGVGIDKLADANALERVATLADDNGNPQRYWVDDLAAPADHAMALAIRIGTEGNCQ